MGAKCTSEMWASVIVSVISANQNCVSAAAKEKAPVSGIAASRYTQPVSLRLSLEEERSLSCQRGQREGNEQSPRQGISRARTRFCHQARPTLLAPFASCHARRAGARPRPPRSRALDPPHLPPGLAFPRRRRRD